MHSQAGFLVSPLGRPVIAAQQRGLPMGGALSTWPEQGANELQPERVGGGAALAQAAQVHALAN